MDGGPMSIVKSYSKANDTTYVYEQDMKWNPVTKRPEGTRKLIGKIDPVTGEIVPTGKKGRKKKEKTESVQIPSDSELAKKNQKLQAQIDTLREQVTSLYAENSALKKENNVLKKKIDQIRDMVNQ